MKIACEKKSLIKWENNHKSEEVKTTEAVANRGVDTDAPRGENGDQKKRKKEKLRDA